MTADDFRSIALSLPETSESAHMGHPDFRVRGKIFATLWPDHEWGVVILTPEEQARLVKTMPDVFVPVKGGWGRRGSTQVRLDRVEESTLCSALVAAWQRVAPKRLAAGAQIKFQATCGPFPA
jgi:hypothetical protein